MDIPPAIHQEYAFITAKDGEYGNQFTPENIDKFEYSPNPTLDMDKIKGKTKVKEIMSGSILDDERYKNIGNMTVEYSDDMDGKNGDFNSKTNTIRIKKGADESTLLHEIQHAIDKKSGIKNSWSKDSKLAPKLKQMEQSTYTNEILREAEVMLKDGKTNEQVIQYFDKKIKQAKGVDTPESKALLNRYKSAKTLFQRYMNEGKIELA